MKHVRNSLSVTLCAVSLILTGCSTVTQIGTVIGQATGIISPEQAQSITRGAKAVGKTFKDITPEQEYYIGRAVAASILGTYDIVDDRAKTEYVNRVGQALGLASDKPNTYKGYHFLIMQSDEINAFACPGGMILVSEGILEVCETEDDLASVLAHEVAHVQLEHGLKAIKKGRLTSALTVLAAEGARNFGGEQLASLTDAFEGSISDITSTLVNSGYAKKQEFQADVVAIDLMERVGYDPSALVQVLERMAEGHEGDDRGFGSTHPPPDKRVAEARAMIPEGREVAYNKTRLKRFQQAMGR